MFAKRAFQLLLLSAILFQALAGNYLVSGPGKFCLKDYFACRTIKYKYMHWCLEFSDLCDGLGFCDSKKDEACDDNLHIPTGICRGPDGKHCKDVERGTAICSAGCAECTGRDECAACAVNFSGKYCNETCPSGTFGRNCEFDCDNLLIEGGKFDLLCNLDDSVCESREVKDNCKPFCECKRADLTCRPGWIGNHCQVPCPGFTFGRFCSKKCDCVPENSVGCDKTDGTCECKPQFYGAKCEHSCDKDKSNFSKSNLNCLEQRVHTLSNDKTALEKNLNYQKTAVEQKLEDHKSSFEQKLSGHRTAFDEHKAEVSQNFTGLKEAVDQKVRDQKTTFERNLNDQNATIERKFSAHKTALEDHKAEVLQNFTGYKETVDQQFRDHKSSLEGKINEIGIAKDILKQNLDDQRSEFERNLADHRTAFDDLKTGILQNLSGHKTAVDQNLANHRSSLEQNLVSHKSFLEQRLEKLTNDKAALEEQVSDYKDHLTWNSSFTCVAFVLLFVVVIRTHLKNRRLKSDLKVISVRYSEKQRSESISEAKVTFSCTETTHPSDRSNLFRSVLGKFRLAQNVPATSIDQPTYGTSLLQETDKINAEIYATIDELKEKDSKEEIIPMPEN